MDLQLEYYRNLLRHEIVQRSEEGCNVADFEARLEEVRDALAAEALYDALTALEPNAAYLEPSDLAGIRVERPDGPRQLSGRLSEARRRNKILGGWLGRCAGCQLGRPVEGWSSRRIRELLEAAGAWPLTDYFSEGAFARAEDRHALEDGNLRASLREHLHAAAQDDDQDYTVLGLSILEEFGPGFTTEQVGKKWQLTLPYLQTWTAVRQAYRNLMQGFRPPETATRLNPYREWIGAQIRADVWGYAAPCRPERAADMAFRDAALSHVKNGIYGAMFMAAMIAAAFVCDDVETCVMVALPEVPRRSRFSAMVEDCLGWSEETKAWDTALRRLQNRYGTYHPTHTLNNAALVLLALLYGGRDFERTICYAVSGGWDTDCNGATAGSILGVMLGADGLPSKWISPLNDTLYSAVSGFSRCSIAGLAERTAQVGQVFGG